ncbi:nonstructural protein [Blackfly microvirus SF02]|uniref:Nonstructural protein n=1 Tax=Blackfly microvirus SF02 TaxID=2576452 RepID=A0A4P8PJV1_9VIRU|nr:nonstructural protein [Blackfly microvirus SF02]
MRMLLLSVFDSKVGAYMPLFACHTKGEAIRSFSDACHDDKLPFRAHPGDFRLYLLAEFDNQTGFISSITPEPLIGADEVGG